MPKGENYAFLSLKSTGYKVTAAVEERRKALTTALTELTLKEKNEIIRANISKSLRNLARLNKNRKPEYTVIYIEDADWMDAGMKRATRPRSDDGDDDDDNNKKRPRVDIDDGMDWDDDEPENIDVDYESKYDDYPDGWPPSKGSKRPRDEEENDEDYYGFPKKSKPNPFEPKGTKRPRDETYSDDDLPSKRPRLSPHDSVPSVDRQGTKRPRDDLEDDLPSKRPRLPDRQGTKRSRDDLEDDLPSKRPRLPDRQGTKRSRDDLEDEDYFGFPVKRPRPNDVVEEMDIEDILRENREKGRNPVFQIEDDVEEDMEEILRRKRAERQNKPGKPAFSVEIEPLPEDPIEIDPYVEPSRKRSRYSSDEEDEEYESRKRPKIDWRRDRKRGREDDDESNPTSKRPKIVIENQGVKRKRYEETESDVSSKKPRENPPEPTIVIPQRTRTGPVDVTEARQLLAIDPRWRPLTQQQVNRSFRAISRQYHPDKTGGVSQEYFELLTEARDVLLAHVISLGGKNYFGF